MFKRENQIISVQQEVRHKTTGFHQNNAMASNSPAIEMTDMAEMTEMTTKSDSETDGASVEADLEVKKRPKSSPAQPNSTQLNSAQLRRPPLNRGLTDVLRPPKCFSDQILDHIEDGHTNAALELLRRQGPFENDINAKGRLHFQAYSVETVYSYKTKTKQQ